MYTLRKTSVLTVALALMLALLLAVFGGKAADAQTTDPGGDPSTTQNIDPVYIPGNPTCTGQGYGIGYKTDNLNGPFTATKVGDGTFEVTATSSDGVYFDWNSNIGVDAVIVKGGPNSDAFVYDPGIGEVTLDTGLHAPVNNGSPFGLSHIEFCYDVEPLVSKTADTSLDRTFKWTIDKSVTPDTWDLFTGDSGTSKYTVSVTKDDGTDSNWAVSGKITVTNPMDDNPMTISGIQDVVTQGTTNTNASVSNCTSNGSSITLPYQLGPKASLECSYSTGLDSGTNGTNKATATSSTSGIDPGTGTAPVDFSKATINKVNDSINVDDSYAGAGSPWTFSDDGSQTYNRKFTCDGDEGTHDNTATIKETGQSDSAQVKVNCILPAKAKVVKTTTEGSENIGQLPFEFKLYNPAGTLVETKTLDTAGNVTFDADLKTEGTWKIVETLPSGWVSSTPLECTFTVDYPDSAGQTKQCTFDNTEMSRVKLKKLTGVGATPPAVDPNMNWTFNIYSGPHLSDASGSGTAWLNSPLANDTTSGDADGVLEFKVNGQPINLDPNKTYTICEMSVPSGYTAEWKVDRNNDGIAETVVTPYNPNEKDQIPEDLGNRCFDFGKSVTDKLTPGKFLAFEVINTFPGGAPRTPGYWKNWNRCTGGNQAANADRNGGRAKGYTLLENILTHPGITWDDILSDTFSPVPINNCQQAVEILDQRVVTVNNKVGDGKKLASDGARTLAMHLLAAQLNQGNGACDNQNVKDVILAAEKLLDKYNFDGKKTTEYLTSKSADYAYALKLAQYLDAYNNSDCDFTTLPPKPTLQ